MLIPAMFKIFSTIILMTSIIANAATVASLNNGFQVMVSGFEVVDENTHMIEWVGKGKDFRKFVVNDIEAELYAQDKGSQLISVHCKSVPDYKTFARPGAVEKSKAILTRFKVTFPLAVKVRASNGKVWKLTVEHNYFATNLDMPGQHRLEQNFKVVDQHAE
jgi:uncharacterized HAD superfamily protein